MYDLVQMCSLLIFVTLMLQARVATILVIILTGTGIRGKNRIFFWKRKPLILICKTSGTKIRICSRSLGTRLLEHPKFVKFVKNPKILRPKSSSEMGKIANYYNQDCRFNLGLNSKRHSKKWITSEEYLKARMYDKPTIERFIEPLFLTQNLYFLIIIILLYGNSLHEYK